VTPPGDGPIADAGDELEAVGSDVD
jgi:hypothetical protein